MSGLRSRVQRRHLVRRTTNALLPPSPESFGSFGQRIAIVPPARIETPECISIGDDTLIHEHCWLLVQRRPDEPPPSLFIGPRTMLNRFVKIVCLGAVTLEGNVVLGDRCYISDVEYEPGHAELNPGQRPLTEPRPVVIEQDAFLGVGVVVKPGVRIGANAYVGANAVVDKDVPAGSVVVGSPGRVVRQYDEHTGKWERV